MLPSTRHGQLRDRVTQCMLGSVHRYFLFHDREKECELMRQYDYGLDDEASQVAYGYAFLCLTSFHTARIHKTEIGQ